MPSDGKSALFNALRMPLDIYSAISSPDQFEPNLSPEAVFFVK